MINRYSFNHYSYEKMDEPLNRQIPNCQNSYISRLLALSLIFECSPQTNLNAVTFHQ
jgi:hypothetical protein